MRASRSLGFGRVRPAENNQQDALDVLLTASAVDTLLPFMVTANLPHFDAGPNWTVKPDATTEAQQFYDLAIVVCDQAPHLSASVALARGLTLRRIQALVLVPAVLDGSLIDAPDLLTVVACGEFTSGLDQLASVILAPVQQQDQLVCCDWADVLWVLDDGARARLLRVEAPNPDRAGTLLIEQTRTLGNASMYGVLASLHHNIGGGLHDWYSLLNAAKSLVRDDAKALVSAPIVRGSSSVAAALVLTAPSSRYFRT